jgi:phosphoglycerate dehydrogenase-like enzyme
MRLRYAEPHETPEATAIGAEYRPLEPLLHESDYVVLTCALALTTKRLIGLDQRRLMKKTAIFVNIARGAVVVTGDLVTAFRGGLIGGAALDVTDPEPLPPDHPLLTFQNCVVVSHIASVIVQTGMAMSQVIAQAVLDGLAGKRVQYCANPRAYE